jgi:hypothetical protein
MPCTRAIHKALQEENGGLRYTLHRERRVDPPRNLIVHGHGVAGIVLSEGNAACRLSGFLRGTLSHGRGGLNLLRVPFRSDS